MSTKEPIENFSRSRIPTFLGWLPFTVLGLGMVGIPLHIEEIVVLGSGSLPETVVPMALAGIPLALLFALFSGGKATIYSDHLEYRTQSVRFDRVAVAVRKSSRSERLSRTATFELFVPGGDTVSVTQISKPDEFERVLRTHLATPNAQLAEGSDDRTGAVQQHHGTDRIGDRRTFWQYWQADEPLPEVAVVDKATLKSVMDVDSLSVDRLDRVELDNAQALSDISEAAVTPSDAAAVGGN
jgi:hypothetical protein